MNPGDRPLAGTRRHLVDHFALSVSNLDVWIAKLRSEGVKVLEQPYKIGNMRAVMIEGPSREAIELVESKQKQTLSVPATMPVSAVFEMPVPTVFEMTVSAMFGMIVTMA